MNLTTKGDLVLAALRKIGIASNATQTDVEPQSVEDGVNLLITRHASQPMKQSWQTTKRESRKTLTIYRR